MGRIFKIYVEFYRLVTFQSHPVDSERNRSDHRDEVNEYSEKREPVPNQDGKKTDD